MANGGWLNGIYLTTGQVLSQPDFVRRLQDEMDEKFAEIQAALCIADAAVPPPLPPPPPDPLPP